MKEIGEIVFEMEENMSSPMRIFQEFYGLDFCNVIGKGDFGEARRWGDEENIWGMVKKDLGGSFFVEVLGGDEREIKLLDF